MSGVHTDLMDFQFSSDDSHYLTALFENKGLYFLEHSSDSFGSALAARIFL